MFRGGGGPNFETRKRFPVRVRFYANFPHTPLTSLNARFVNRAFEPTRQERYHFAAINRNPGIINSRTGLYILILLNRPSLRAVHVSHSAKSTCIDSPFNSPPPQKIHANLSVIFAFSTHNETELKKKTINLHTVIIRIPYIKPKKFSSKPVTRKKIKLLLFLYTSHDLIFKL